MVWFSNPGASGFEGGGFVGCCNPFCGLHLNDGIHTSFFFFPLSVELSP